jgi:hypothetical protein
MAKIQPCPMCHIFMTLKNGKIINQYSKNYPYLDESLMRYIQNPEERVLPHAPQKANRFHTILTDIRLDKKIMF